MKFVLVKKKTLFKVVSLFMVLAVAILGVTITGASAVYNGQTVRKIPIYCVDTEEKVVALSFDASWGADKTMAILDVLKEHDVSANYFVIGSWAEKYSIELKALADSGRVEIGTHSNTHPHMTLLTESQMELELSASVDIIKGITGQENVDLFRAPFGEYSDKLLGVTESMGLYTIQWDVDTLDWMDISSYEINERVLSRVTNGSIVLMHNDGKNTLEALPSMILGLKNKGYKIVTIGELIYRDNYTIDHTGKQIRS